MDIGPLRLYRESYSIPGRSLSHLHAFLDDGVTQRHREIHSSTQLQISTAAPWSGMGPVFSVPKKHGPTSGVTVGSFSQLVRKRRTSPFSKTTKFKGWWLPFWLLRVFCKSGADNRLLFSLLFALSSLPQATGMSQVTAASVVIFCFGLSPTRGGDFEKERIDIQDRGKYQTVFNYVLINVLSQKGLWLQE